MPNPSPWNEQRIELMKKIYRNGSFTWLARELNKLTGGHFTRSGVAGKLNRLGLISPMKPNKITTPRKRTHASAHSNGEAVVEDAEFLGIDLIDLQFDSCRYPQGERAPFAFCGQRALDGQPYCQRHYKMTHTASPPMRRLNW